MLSPELFGYSASAVIMLSFLLSDMRKLRIINTIGCMLFVIYGCMLDFDMPLIITNVFIVLVNAYHLFIKSA